MNIQNTDSNKKKQQQKKKAVKFKCLGKAHFSSESEIMLEENSIDMMSIEDNAFSPELISDDSWPIYSNKRKKISEHEEENSDRKSLTNFKKLKSNSILDVALSTKHLMESKQPSVRVEVNDSDSKASGHKSKDRTHISCVQVKHITGIKSERLRKNGQVWSQDCPSNSWTIQEDKVLCGAVYSYGPHWELVSDLIYSILGGGFYRGRYRHPLHCFKRFQELFCKHILLSVDILNTDKVSSGTAKTTLKAYEGVTFFNDQAHALLNVISELPNNELLLQKHFMAVLSSVWRSKYLCCHVTDIYSGALDTFSPSKKPRRSRNYQTTTTCRPSVELVKKALAEAQVEQPGVVIPVSSSESYHNHLGLELDFLTEQADYDTDFPSVVNVFIYEPEPPKQASEPVGRSLLTSLSCRRAESRFRVASAGCFEGEESSHWALSSVLPTSPRHISGLTSLGKYKAASESRKSSKSKVRSIIEQQEESIEVRSFPHSPGQPSTSVTEFHFSQSLLDVGISGSELVLSDTLAEEYGHTEFLPYQCDSSFLADMEELDPISDFTDIG